MIAAVSAIQDPPLVGSNRRQDPAISPNPLIRRFRTWRQSARPDQEPMTGVIHLTLVSDELGILFRLRGAGLLREGEVPAIGGWTPDRGSYTLTGQNFAVELFNFHVESRAKTAEDLWLGPGLLRMAGVVVDHILASLADASSRPTLILRPTGVFRHVPWSAARLERTYLVETFDIAIDDGLPASKWVARTPHLTALSGTSKTMAREAERVAKLAAHKGLDANHAPLTLAALNLALANATMVHLATHFRAHPHDGGQAEIQLSDGRWFQIADLAKDLDGLELLFLGGCETGTELDQIDGPGGNLIDQWRIAGAQSVVSTLWRISDDASERLSMAFYRRLLDGAGRAAALADAQRDVLAAGECVEQDERFLDFVEGPSIKRTRFDHPRHWAALYLTGEIGSVSMNGPGPSQSSLKAGPS
jgi:hypothetical protein